MTRRNNKRTGAIIPLAALLAVFLLGMVAFAVDVGWMAVSQSELQNVADAAALAGAGPLMDGYIHYNLPGNTANQTTILANTKNSAINKAKEYAGYNSAGGASALTLLDGDIEFGYTDAKGNYAPSTSGLGVSVAGVGVAVAVGSTFPNTIKVTVRRDSTANGNLSLFFGRVLGTSTTTLTATASATIYGGTLNMLPGGGLPITYNQKYWKNFLATGLDADGGLRKDANGNPQLQGYPSLMDTGNFGLISLDDQHVGANDVRAWINNGLSQADLQALIDADLVPLTAHDSTKWDWEGENGFKASVVMDINDHVGKVYVLPLYKEYSETDAGNGNGSHYEYNIVEFVGIRIMPPTQSNREVVIQPAAVTAPDTYFDSTTIAPIGSSSNLVTTFTAPKLTR